MVNLCIHERPDPLEAMQKGRTKPQPVAASTCEGCNATMSPEQIAVCGPRWCEDCHEEEHTDADEDWPRCKCGKPLTLGWTQARRTPPRLLFAGLYDDIEHFELRGGKASTYTEHDIRKEDGTLVWRGRCQEAPSA